MTNVLPAGKPVDYPKCPKVMTMYSSWESRVCGKPCRTAEQQKWNLCGAHLAARKRVQAATERRHAEYAVRDAIRDASNAARDALINAVGEDIEAYSTDRGVVLSPAAVATIVARMAQSQMDAL